MEIKPKKSPSIGFSGLLTLLFIALKLTGHITWSWWWVLSPIAIQLTIGVLLIALAVIIEKNLK
jgi:predicted tellurium resistance membrane protein TerC